MPVYGAGAQPSTRDEIAELCRNVLRLPTRVSPTAPWVALATPTPSSCAALGCVPRMASVAARVSGGAAYGADIAAAQQVFAARQRLGEDVVGLAHAIKTHALARLGELLAEMPKATTVIVAARASDGAACGAQRASETHRRHVMPRSAPAAP